MRVGLCGFTISAAAYFETFPVVEVQQTFYEPPSQRTLLRWREQSPDGPPVVHGSTLASWMSGRTSTPQ